ncbi:hypothetical protein FRC02_011311 [Tulasnella sp. 418]|nr:hypothetical protein FRC02_011311 [Tulasnella sp. 418]
MLLRTTFSRSLLRIMPTKRNIAQVAIVRPASDTTASSPKKRVRRAREEIATTISGNNGQEEVKYVRRSTRTRVSTTTSSTVEIPNVKLENDEELEEDEEDGEPTIVRKASKRRRGKKAADDDSFGEHEDEAESPKKTKRARKKKTPEPVVYDISPVERLETSFKGRLGYACLNTILRSLKPDSVFCSRTCRISTIQEKGMDYVKELGLQNIRDLSKMIEWNEANNIRFMRISSEVFPFASHGKYGYTLEYADKDLKATGDLAKRYQHRLTLHPGQFTQIGSPKDEVVTASVRELNYHCEMLDRMGLDQDSVMIIHMGGVYGDKASTLERFKKNYTELLSESVKKRLVLENDELCYNLDDIMPVCKELDIPIVVDYHHDWIYPSQRPVSELIPIINETWIKKGIRIKQHLSEPRPGATTPMEKRAHADRCSRLPDCLPDDVDLMIEAKDKEQAVFELYRIYGLKDVIWENLRPPKKHQTLATAGRKSAKGAKKKKDVEEELLAEEGIACDPEDIPQTMESKVETDED